MTALLRLQGQQWVGLRHSPNSARKGHLDYRNLVPEHQATSSAASQVLAFFICGGALANQKFPRGSPIGPHCLVLDGVYRCGPEGVPVFVEAGAPRDDELHALLHTVIARLMKMLTRRGVLIEEMGQIYLADPNADGDEARTLRPLQAAAITYRIAFGPRAGQKVLTLRGAMARFGLARELLCSDIDGFSLHAAVRVEAHERKRLEQLCRYITRPALADERVQLNAAGQVELKLKTPWRDGTTHLVMSPLEFMQRLAALVPRPRLHLISPSFSTRRCFSGNWGVSLT